MNNITLKLLPFILMGILIPSFIEVDITLPAFPQLAEFFQTSEAAIQWTLTANFLGLCLLTLVYGPLSDIIGRKKTLLIGCILFFLGSIGCSLMDNLIVLYFFRFLQGVGCSAIWVVGFTVCSDQYQGEKSIYVFGLLNAAISTALIFAPVIGAVVVSWYHWHRSFVTVAILSTLPLLLVTFVLPETHKAKTNMHFNTVINQYIKLTSSWRFLAYALTPSILLSGFIAFISTVPFLYINQLKMSYYAFAIYQAIPGAALAMIGFLSGAINRKIGSANCILLSITICTLGTMLLYTSSIYMPTSANFYTFSMTIICIGSALQFSIVFSRSLEIFPELQGAASSLITLFRLIIFSISTFFSSQLYSGQLHQSAIVIIYITFTGLALSLFVRNDINNSTAMISTSIIETKV